MTTWRKEIEGALKDRGESWSDVVGSTLSADEMDAEFHDWCGGTNGCPFTLWTVARVYFPAVYDGAEWVASVPRNPCDEKTDHVGEGYYVD